MRKPIPTWHLSQRISLGSRLWLMMVAVCYCVFVQEVLRLFAMRGHNVVLSAIASTGFRSHMRQVVIVARIRNQAIKRLGMTRDGRCHNPKSGKKHIKMATVTQTLESANADGKPIKLAVAYDDTIHNSVSMPQETTGYFMYHSNMHNSPNMRRTSPSMTPPPSFRRPNCLTSRTVVSKRIRQSQPFCPRTNLT